MAKKYKRKPRKQIPMYGYTAIYATQLLHGKRVSDPEEAWNQSARALITSTSSRFKSCPMTTFRGLCDLGLIRDVPPATHQVKPMLNNDYTRAALKLLESHPEVTYTPKTLWEQTLAAMQLPADRRHNEQMTVICTLWDEGLLVGSPAKVVQKKAGK
jgi:hypothetical protein